MNKVTMEQREAIVREAISKRDAIAAAVTHPPALTDADSALPPLPTELLHRLDLSVGGNGFAMAAALDVVETFALEYGRMVAERCAEDAARYRKLRTALPDGVIFDREFEGPEELDAAIDAEIKEAT